MLSKIYVFTLHNFYAALASKTNVCLQTYFKILNKYLIAFNCFHKILIHTNNLIGYFENKNIMFIKQINATIQTGIQNSETARS